MLAKLSWRQGWSLQKAKSFLFAPLQLSELFLTQFYPRICALTMYLEKKVKHFTRTLSNWIWNIPVPSNLIKFIWQLFIHDFNKKILNQCFPISLNYFYLNTVIYKVINSILEHHSHNCSLSSTYVPNLKCAIVI